MTDKNLSNLWIVNFDGTKNRPLTTGKPKRFCTLVVASGTKLLYKSNIDGTVQIYLRWMDNGATARLTNLLRPPAGMSWSPDGKWIAFSMFVPKTKSLSPPFHKTGGGKAERSPEIHR